MNKTQTVISQVVLACVLSTASLSAETVSYDNTGSWNGYGSIYPWSSPAAGGTQTYGEKFIAPTANTVSLDTYTFYLHEQGKSGDTISFEAAIYEWDAVNGCTIGSALFTQNLAFTDSGSFQAVTINTGGVTLSSGENYVAFLTTTDPVSSAANGSLIANFEWGWVESAQANDGGGELVFYNTEVNSRLSDGSAWTCASGYGRLAWKADFTVSTVPEPTTLALLGLGTSGLLAYRRRIKNS